MVEQFGLSKHLNKQLDKLSLGMQKKVLLISALASTPSILLLDEPTDELDQNSKQVLINILKQRQNLLTIISTHDTYLLKELPANEIKLG